MFGGPIKPNINIFDTYKVHGGFYFVGVMSSTVTHSHNNLLLSHFKQSDQFLFFEFNNL